MKLLTRAYQVSILRPYFSFRTWWPFWFYILNAPNRSFLKEHRPGLEGAALRILEDLRARGIAQTSLGELFPDQPTLLADLQAYAQKLGEGSSVNRKVFLLHLWNPKGFVLENSNPFSRLITDSRIAGIAASYMGLAPKLHYMTLARSVPSSDTPMESQRWHRDPEEKRICKMFIYLTDVTKGTGAFEYITETVYGMRDGNRFPQKPPYGVYPPASEVEAAFPSERRRLMEGLAGTVLFCDTTGIHRGGYCTTGERIMYTLSYAAPTLCLAGFDQRIAADVVTDVEDPITKRAIELLR
jgi:hypothetical protein